MKSKPQAGEKKSITCCSTAVTVTLQHISSEDLKSLQKILATMELFGFSPEKKREMEPMNGSTYLLMRHTHPHPSFPIPPCIKDCVDHRASESNPDTKLRCGENLLWFGFQDFTRREQERPAEDLQVMHALRTVLSCTERGFAVGMSQPGSQQTRQLQD